MQADVTTQTATINYDPKLTKPAALIEAINKHTRFKASVRAT